MTQQLQHSRLWEKCARKLSLNSEVSLNHLKITLDSILIKCIENPNESKYFSLKTTNKSFQSNVLAHEGGIEFLIAVGFQPELQNGDKILHLIDFAIEQLRISMDWLNDTVKVCLEMKQSRNIAIDAPCAECHIQIRLPTGAVVSGGFMRTDLVKDVLSYSHCFFQENCNVSLRFGYSTVSLTGDQLERTLADAGLYPRAMLLASTIDDKDLSATMQQAAELAAARMAAAEEAKKDTRSQHVASSFSKAQVREEERRKTLLAFKDDRADKKPFAR